MLDSWSCKSKVSLALFTSLHTTVYKLTGNSVSFCVCIVDLESTGAVER